MIEQIFAFSMLDLKDLHPSQRAHGQRLFPLILKVKRMVRVDEKEGIDYYLLET